MFAVQCMYMGSAIGVGYWLSIVTLRTPEDLVSLPAARCLLTALRIALPCADCCSGPCPRFLLPQGLTKNGKPSSPYNKEMSEKFAIRNKGRLEEMLKDSTKPGGATLKPGGFQ